MKKPGMSIIERAKEVAEEFEYGEEDVQRATKHFIKQMNEGLERDGATMGQIPSYVTSVPNGTEKGLYLAVDLGGTNLRICSVDLLGDTKFSILQSKCAIPSELMFAKTAAELFAFLATKIEVFLQTHHSEQLLSHRRKPMEILNQNSLNREGFLQLGFTFSFAFEQHALNRGSLLYWTKGFNIPDAIGKDICGLLQEEIDKLRLPVTVAALVNDTVGTLLARSYEASGTTKTLLGAIFGTGTNGAYVEKMSNLKKMKVSDNPAPTEMIVNTEWGSFDNELSVLPNTPYDIAVDMESLHPGIQMFEKRISGLYLGEILRYAILAIAPFSTTMIIRETSLLYKQFSIDTSFLSTAAADLTSDLSAIRQELAQTLGVEANHEDSEAIRRLVLAIGRRAARLAGVAIAAVVIKSGRLSQSTPRTNLSYPAAEDKPSLISTYSFLPEASTKPAINFFGRFFQWIRAFFLQWTGRLAPKPAIIAPVTSDLPEIVDIGVDGSLIEHYPDFEALIRTALREVDGIGLEGEKRIRIGIAKDGSGVGAALVARMADLRT
ncbi:hypothetical protein G7Y89_g14871 [Cudoniella acicularis]|uniref:Phosphotransferase n=1 Tax=Cudoniella acicularis TaxID=354080 RepID=A0A8H4QXG4_9HELO|nr:hypothetical protein G7Y89_g14871 [Cudoniella acicularis]